MQLELAKRSADLVKCGVELQKSRIDGAKLLKKTAAELRAVGIDPETGESIPKVNGGTKYDSPEGDITENTSSGSEETKSSTESTENASCVSDLPDIKNSVTSKNSDENSDNNPDDNILEAIVDPEDEDEDLMEDIGPQSPAENIIFS